MSFANQNHISKKEIKKHKKVLNGHLRDFFALLDSTPKPSDEKVRAEFIRHEFELRMYGTQHHLGTRLAELFNANVSLEWERKYTRKENQ